MYDGNQKSKYEDLFRSRGNHKHKLSQKHRSYKQQNDATPACGRSSS